MTPEDVTLVQNALHNPADPRHFMRVVPDGKAHSATIGDATLASSSDALVVKEVAFDIYDPVVYFPRDGVNLDLLDRTDKSTHCPLKGDTEYFDAVINGERITDIAWSYVEMIGDAEVLRSYVAFDTSKVTVD
jgi:uncharacterized protein (DUF427 family)